MCRGVCVWVCMFERVCAFQSKVKGLSFFTLLGCLRKPSREIWSEAYYLLSVFHLSLAKKSTCHTKPLVIVCWKFGWSSVKRLGELSQFFCDCSSAPFAVIPAHTKWVNNTLKTIPAAWKGRILIFIWLPYQHNKLTHRKKIMNDQNFILHLRFLWPWNNFFNLFCKYIEELCQEICIASYYCDLERNLCYFSYSFPNKISYRENLLILTNLEANRKKSVVFSRDYGINGRVLNRCTDSKLCCFLWNHGKLHHWRNFLAFVIMVVLVHF